MRWPVTLFALGLIPLAGCHLANMAAHNAWNEPVEYLDQQALNARLKGDARKALRDVQDRLGPRAFGDDFGDGFIDGYVDYLEHGGQSLPPAVPPLKYRRSRFMNPDGHARIHEYFAGFQQGADTACHSGERSYLTVPVLLPEPPQEQPPNVKQSPKEDCAPNSPENKPTTPKSEPLATPRTEPGLPTPVRPVDPLPPPVAPKPETKPPVPDVPKVPMTMPTPSVEPGTPKLPPPPDPPKLDIPKTTTTPLFHNFPKGTGGNESRAEPELPGIKKTGLEIDLGTTNTVVPPLRDSEPLVVKPR
jgi:hypothetical protein